MGQEGVDGRHSRRAAMRGAWCQQNAAVRRTGGRSQDQLSHLAAPLAPRLQTGSAPEEASTISMESGNHCLVSCSLYQSSSIETEKLSLEFMNLYDVK